MGVEPVEIDLPAGRMLRAEGTIVEGVDEHEDAAVAVRRELEAEQLAAPGPLDHPRGLELRDLAALTHGLEHLACFRLPRSGRDEPLLELCRLGHCTPDAFNGMIEAAPEAQRRPVVDVDEIAVDHGFSSRCRSSASRRSDQYAR